MRITRAHERSQIIIAPHPRPHRITRRPTASPSGAAPVTPAAATTPALAPARAASPGTGPAAFLAAHPWAYLLSLAGSSAAAVYGLTTARQDTRHRMLRLALGAHCAAQSAGIVIATETARRHAQPAGEPAETTESHPAAKPGPQSTGQRHDQ